MKTTLLPEQKTVILVNGIPASGKSTVTRELSGYFGVPSLTIDGIKEPFMAKFDAIDRPFNRKLGCAAYEVIWSIVGQAPANCLWIVDAWFGFQPKEDLLGFLQQAGVGQVLEVWNQISPELAVARYGERLNDRKMGHPGEEYLPELARLAASAKPMVIGPVFTLNQDALPATFTRLTDWVTDCLKVSQPVAVVP
jgi:hypothetical protein